MKQYKVFEDYTKRYLQLKTSQKYSLYSHTYKELYRNISNARENQILFINKAPMDVDFFALFSDVSKFSPKKIYLSGINFKFNSYKYFFDQIKTIKEDYDFVDTCLQVKFNPAKWKINKKKFDQIQLIIIPVQIVSGDKKQCVVNDKKLYKFIKKFKKAKIIAMGYDFSLISKKDFEKLETTNILKIDDFIIFNIDRR